VSNSSGNERLPTLTNNWVSATGAVVSVAAFLIILFLSSLSLILGISHPYVGILIYILLPVPLILGLLLIPTGMYFRWRHWQREGTASYKKWPSLDLNDRSGRNAFTIFVLGSLLFILASAVGTYQAYQYTESVEFCGKICHTVMKPEYTAYQDSPHARVNCVECHIGPGVGWYAKSKLSGLYQVYSVLAKVYPRPIPTPISHLRPARETCEQCHWPGQFFGGIQRRFDHYMYDKNNSRWAVNMLLKVGGGNPMKVGTAGIHWHVNPGVTVEYIARGAKREDIPWVRVTDRQSSSVKIFQDESKPLSSKDISKAVPRVMDCMDCHNRPSHNFHSPDYEIDMELSSGRIDASIREIKKVAVLAMTRKYQSESEALKVIETSINDYYRTSYPELLSSRKEAIIAAIKSTQEVFCRSNFPSMKTKWSDYPNTIGHFIFRGCMRCHDGNHKDEKGLPIPHDCRTCHIILEQGKSSPDKALNLEFGLDFQHPVDIGSAWKNMGCYECHSGIQP